MSSAESHYKEYLDFVAKYSKHLGYKGDYSRGEIEMVFDISLFPKCEEGSAKRMIESGISPEDARRRAQIGIFDESRWGVSVHEPLRLPDGSYTTFNRWISWGTLESGLAGVVVVPETSDGRFIFIKTFRNATKNWCLEFPRGGKDPGNSLLKTLKNELSEETGASMVKDPEKIGEVYPDSGVLASKVEIFLAKVEVNGLPRREATEAIGGIVFVSKKDIKGILKTQKYLDEKGKKYEFKDGFTLSALSIMMSLDII